MNTEFIIADTSVRYMNAANVLQEFLFYCKDNNWSRNIDNTVKYSDSNAAIDSAKKLKAEDGLDKKVFLFQKNSNVINIGEVKVPI